MPAKVLPFRLRVNPPLIQKTRTSAPGLAFTLAIDLRPVLERALAHEQAKTTAPPPDDGLS